MKLLKKIDDVVQALPYPELWGVLLGFLAVVAFQFVQWIIGSP